MKQHNVLASFYSDYELSTLEDLPLTVGGSQPGFQRAVNRAARAVGQLVVTTERGVKVNGKGALRAPATKLRHAEFGSGLPLYQGTCSDIGAYFDQYQISAFGTATLFRRRNWILTAHHSIIPDDIENTYFVFGRTHESSSAAPRQGARRIRVGGPSFVRCKKIVDGLVGKGGAMSGNDWVIIELEDHLSMDPLPLYEDDGPGLIPSDVFVLQHPLGLPLKYSAATPLEVDANGGENRVYTDAGGGSSGSPLIFATLQESGEYNVELYGVLGGADVNLGVEHHHETPTGMTLDPSGTGTTSPSMVITPAQTIKDAFGGGS